MGSITRQLLIQFCRTQGFNISPMITGDVCCEWNIKMTVILAPDCWD